MAPQPLHELTRRLSMRRSTRWSIWDEEIRAYLVSKVELTAGHWMLTPSGITTLKAYFGLTAPETAESEKERDGWCEHIKISGDSIRCKGPWGHFWDELHGHWKFCPICGASRPKEKERTLEEKLEEFLRESFATTDEGYKKRANELAQLVEKEGARE